MDLDMEEQKVTVKGNVDAYKVYEALRKKCGKRTELLYPQFSKEDEKKAKEDAIINSVNKIVDSITDLLNPKVCDWTFTSLYKVYSYMLKLALVVSVVL